MNIPQNLYIKTSLRHADRSSCRCGALAHCADGLARGVARLDTGQFSSADVPRLTAAMQTGASEACTERRSKTAYNGCVRAVFVC
jgi:hypothetical protein